MKKGKLGIGIIIALALIIVAASVFRMINPVETHENDHQKFAKEYQEVTEDNVFVYRDANQIIKILENGKGVVYLGFPECPWCQRYVKYLNEVAKDIGIEKIYYYNIREARNNNTEEYQKMVSILEEHLQFDEEGNKRIYAPSIIAVDSSKIIGFDDETAWDTKGHEKPSDYWTEDEVGDLKEKLKEMMNPVNDNLCTNCN